MSRKRDQRLLEIRRILEEKKEMKVSELAEALSVTPETIRKDLDELCAQKLAVRSHGMVRVVQSISEAPFSLRKTDNLGLKQAVAWKAMSEIKDGMTVYLDPGSTLLSGVDMLRSKKDLTVVVSSIPMALEVMKLNFRVIFLGGVIVENEMRTEGYFTEEMIDKIHLDLAILGTCGMHNADGFGVFHDVEIGSRRKLIQQSDKIIVAMDKTKLDQPTCFQFCRFDEVDMVITNQLNDKERSLLSAVPNLIEVS